MNSCGDDEEIKFTWRIVNCDLLWHAPFHPSNYKKGFTTRILRSPLISVGDPCHTLFHLDICARFTKHCSRKLILNYDLFRLGGSFEGYFEGQVLLDRRVSRSSTLPVFDSKFPSRGLFVHERFLLRETLFLECRFMFPKPYQYISYLTELKQNINALYLSGEYSDLTLYTRDKEFFVHKFFLHKRAPKLLEDIGLLEENCTTVRVKVDKISTPVLQTLLHYIYSGEINVLPRESLPELYECLEKYQFQEMLNVIHLKKSARITTQLKVSRRILFCKADVRCALRNSREKIILYEPINLECARFLVESCFQTIQSSTWIRLRVHCLSSLDEDILMSCTISTGLRRRNLKRSKKEIFVYSSKVQTKLDFTVAKLNYTFNELENGFYLMLNLAASKGREFTAADYVTPITPQHFSLFGMGVMRYGIKEIGKTFNISDIEDGVKDVGDVNLLFDCGGVLSVHKIVLAAWSPVFSAMFLHEMKEKNSGEVIIIDINYETGLRLMHFLYSGVLLEYSYEEYQELYVAADKYMVSLLLGECRSYLASHLTLGNACCMLVLADQHNDRNLLEKVQKYIGLNAFYITRSSEWLSLYKTHIELVNNTLAYVPIEQRYYFRVRFETF